MKSINCSNGGLYGKLYEKIGCGKNGFRVGLQSEKEKDKHIVLEVPRKFKDNVVDILNANYNNWEIDFKILPLQ